MFVCFEQCLSTPFMTKKTPEEIEETEWTSLSIISSEIKPFCYKGMILKGIVTKVYDGDTVQLVIQHDDAFESHRFRLIGVKAPELHDEEEKELALQSKESLQKKLAEDGNYVVVQFNEDDRYGRRTGILLTRAKESVNQWMIEQGFAESEEKAMTINRSLTIRQSRLTIENQVDLQSEVQAIIDDRNEFKRSVTFVMPESPMYTPRELVVPDPQSESIEEIKLEETIASQVTL